MYRVLYSSVFLNQNDTKLLSKKLGHSILGGEGLALVLTRERNGYALFVDFLEPGYVPNAHFYTPVRGFHKWFYCQNQAIDTSVAVAKKLKCLYANALTAENPHAVLGINAGKGEEK